MKTIERLFNSKLVAVLSILLLTAIFIPNVQAASLTTLSDTMTNLNATGTSNHTISFTTPTGIHSGDTITITFPAATFSHGDGTLTGVTIADGVGADNAVTSATWATPAITITASASSVVGANNTAKIIIPTAQMTNPAAGTYVVSIAGDFGDTGQFAVVIITNDQVVVNATVDPTLTFAITNNSVTLLTAGSGNPDASNTAFNGANTLVAGTNATGGYVISYNGATLTSGGNTITAIGGTAATSSTGNEQFGLNLKDNATPNVGTEASGGSGVASANYNTADSYAFAAGAATQIASAAGLSATTTYTVSYIANIAANTQAGAYSTTITYICTGTF